MSNLKELAARLNNMILDRRTRMSRGQDDQWGVSLSWDEAQDVVDLIEQATQPERPAPDPTARPFPEPQDFTLVPITEKQAVGMAFDMYDSGYNVRIFRPDGGFDIELNHDKPFKP